MLGLSKVIVLDPDARAGRQVQLGFGREGIAAEAPELPRDPAELTLLADGVGLVIVGGAELRALELLRYARQRLDDAGVDAPILFVGRGVRRTDAEAAGADEVLLPPTYLRDVVTIGRLLYGQPARRRHHLVGTLAETTGVLTLVRALAALGRSAVLTLIRGLRRGEVRFYHGEVTSAQVGFINGQAALHQLLLWTDARFDFHHEDIVRRHQIPLDRDELFADAERFLTGVRESSGRLSPSMVLEPDQARLAPLGKQIPAEVYGLLRMFDGHRVLADVLEDSPYRLFETLRVAQLAVEAGLLRLTATPRPKPKWRTVLPIEEWLVSSELREEPGEPSEPGAGASTPIPRAVADAPSGRAKSGPNRAKGSRKKKKKRRASTPAPGAAAGTSAQPAKQEIDWGALVPRTLAAEAGPVAGVVPAAHASGEITLPGPVHREGQADAGPRDRPVAPEAKVKVEWDEAAGGPTAAERAREAERAQEAATAATAVEDEQTTTTIRMGSMAETMSTARAAAASAETLQGAPTERMPTLQADAAPEPQGPPTERMPTLQADAAPEPQGPPTERMPVIPTEPAAAPTELAAAPTEPAAAPTEPAAAPTEPAAAPTEPAAASTEPAPAPTEPAATPTEPTTAPTEPAAAPTEPAAAPTEPATAPTEPAAAPTEPATASTEPAPAPTEPATASTEPAAAPTEPAAAPTEPATAPTEPAAIAPSEPPATAAAPAAAAAEPSPTTSAAAAESPATPAAAPIDAPPAAAESPATTVVTEAAATADVPSEATPSAAPAEPPPTATTAPSAAAAAPPPVEPGSTPSTGTPAGELPEEPSDGIVRQTLFTAETAPAPLRPPPIDIPEDDRPEDMTGEIVTRTGQMRVVEPRRSEPSILVADLAEVHSAVAAVAEAQAAAAPPPTMATPVTAQAVGEVSDDAAEAFSDLEEDFFRAGQEKTRRPPSHSDSFEDLDEGYKPVGFWDRLLGRKPPKR
jgi:hypothetical protein